ncbi:outer membrane beta-barrel protein [Fibrella sp. HMF5335]|uniref:Outer membrane beta-barrel protein n=1 Tax=Fibrella rubiginis TaxID=2817060 RepID=A0A939GF84_9BACT|nr:outer membrane beta-barrel protein [Fibrella rubiginis]MBO0936703.1 outer membrane beta-barrel protein [Fibrella rubiginis]
MKQLRTLLTLTLVVSGLLASLTGFGQANRRPDQIVRYDNTVIDALISEIDETSVSYRKTSAPQGALYRVKKSEISYVRYTNGEVERFDGKGAKTTPARPTAMVASRTQPAARLAPVARANEAKTRFGLTVGGGAGLFLSSVVNSDMGMALRGGLTAEIPLGSSIALAPSVEFLRFSRTESKITTALNYGVVTLAIVPLYKEGKSVNLFYSLGAYGAYGINITAEGESASFKELGVSTFHAGGDLKLGARFSQALTIYAQGDYGFTTMAADAPKGAPQVTQATFGLGIRYLFGN